MSEHLLVDGDILVMKAAFASERTVIKDKGNTQITVKELVPQVDYTRVIDDLMYEFSQVFPDSNIVTIIGGNNNFRKEVDPNYKKNRDPQDRPLMYEDCRDWLRDKYSAHSVDGVETDDVLGMLQCMAIGDTCIASIDKDLNTIPGEHYNIDKGDHYLVTPEQAEYNFYFQMLTGDSTDNITGLPRVGKVKARKILMEGDNLLNSALGAYEDRLGEDFKQHWDLTLKLVRILQHPTELPDESYDNRKAYQLACNVHSLAEREGIELNETLI